MSDLSYRRLLYFFLPLALTPMLIGSTHMISSATLARLPYPELSLAVFAVARGLTDIIKAPTLMSTQVVMSFIDDRMSYQLVKKALFGMSGIILFVLFLIGYTPLGSWVLKNIIGLKGKEHIEFAYLALRITCLLPVVEIYRNFYQGIAVSLKKTNFIIPGIIMRLSAVFIFFWICVRLQLLPGMVVGSIAWVGGIGLEAIFIYIYLKWYYGSPLKAVTHIKEKNKSKITLARIVKFFIPLGLMMFLTHGLQPIIQSGIARGALPTKSLAAYGVAWTILLFVAGPLRRIHQCSLVFTHHPGTAGWKKVLYFSLSIGFMVSIMFLLSAVTPAGFWFINSIMAVSEELTVMVQQTMLAFSIYPIIRSFRESYWGLLMQKQTTNIIAIAKGINLGVVVLTFVVVNIISSIPGAVTGALAFTAGEGIETLVIWYYVSSTYNSSHKRCSVST
ncbi:MAG: hypothetical protein ACOCQN_02990 [Halanaerobiaceae bacterium]